MPIIVPTKRCNLRCNHCMRSTFASEFLDPGLHDKFVEDMTAIRRQPYWCWTGGEPTLHPEMDELFQSYRKRNYKNAAIMTNGQIDWGVETVIKNKDVVNFIRLSLDGPTAEVNDKIRGVGSFDIALNSMKEYIKAGIPVSLGVTVHEENLDLAEACFELALSQGANGITIWGNQQWVDVNSSENRTKSLKTTKEDIEWTEETSKRIRALSAQLNKKYKPKFKGGATVSTKFDSPKAYPKWVCENYSNDPAVKVDRERRIVLLPEGKVSSCCDLYDVNYNYSKFEASPFDENPVSDILGDFSKQSLEEILVQKDKTFAELARRRKRDSAAGLLKDGRENICTNCAYYHYQPSKSKTDSKLLNIPIKTL